MASILVSELSESCTGVVKQLKGITATYRMTSKGPPVRHSHYVSGILGPLTTFLGTQEARQLSRAARQRLLSDTVEAVSAVSSRTARCAAGHVSCAISCAAPKTLQCSKLDALFASSLQVVRRCEPARALPNVFPAVIPQRYAALADELVAAVQKTESSLRRLKKGKAGAEGGEAAGAAAMSDADKICLQLFLDAREYGRLATMLQVRHDISLLQSLARECRLCHDQVCCWHII